MPTSDPTLTAPWDLPSIEALLRDGDLLGTRAIGRFEARLEAHFGRRHALCLASATQALHALAIALELRGGEVIVPPFTWGGTLAPFLLLDAACVFADVDPLQLTLDAEAARGVVTPKARAVIGVDWFGNPADDRALRSFADAHGLIYIHDAAQSFGATREGRPAGQLAHAVVLSFSPGKPLSAGEGGAILTDDSELYERLVHLTQHPLRQRLELGLRVGNEFGLNGRIHPVSAAWACFRFDAELSSIRARQQAALSLLGALSDSQLCRVPFSSTETISSFRALTAAWIDRNAKTEVRRLLCEQGYGHRNITPLTLTPLYQQNAFLRLARDRWRGSCRASEEHARRCFRIDPTD